MTRRRTPRPATQAQALIALAALPLVLTTSNVGVTSASAARAGDGGPAPTAASLDAITADDLADLPESDTLEAVPAAFQVPERPALGTPRAGDIPWAALQAYQRAADILGEVQPSCGLSWTLLGAVGQVESEHGTVRGGELGGDGVVSPELLSRTLDGQGRRPAVEDTDGGELDGDDTWDRAVGPMQLLPGVWSLVGVDGDGDGNRSAQDVDDAALAAAVYLCSVGTDLSDPHGAEKALAEYNGAEGYARQVLAVEKRYADRDFDVSGAPKPSSIGATLDDGQGSPAQESERALREAEEQREEQPALSARRTHQAAGSDASPAPQKAPEAGPSQAPADRSPDGRSEEGVTPRPDDDETGEATEAPVEPAAPVDEAEPGHRPDAESADEPAGGTDDEPTGGTDGSADQPEQPAEPAERPGESDEATGDEPHADPGDDPTDGGQPTDGDDPTDRDDAAPTEEADDGDPAEGEDAAEQPADDTDAADEPADGEDTEDPAAEPTDKDAENTGVATGAESDETDVQSEADVQEPTTVPVTGELTVCGQGFCLDGALLDLSAAGDPTAEAGADLDGDATVETLADELAGLQGRTVELLVIEGSEPLLVVAVDGHVVVPD